ncbi:MAG: co-chaperone GroES [Flavobacteriales bacterium]|jgi:chaperonin GroES
MSVNIKPLSDRVVIEPVPVEEKTASGIIIPDASKEKPLKGKVVAAGPGKVDEPMTVKSGDTVLYGQYSGTEVKLDGTTYLIMREADIFGILN